MELNGKVALITGGARIGAEVARQFSMKGCDLVLTYRQSAASARQSQREIESSGGRCLLVKADLTRASDVSGVYKKIGRTFGRLDILINMVSIYEKTPMVALTEAKWDRMLAANLKSGFLLVQGARPLLLKNGGRIVHISDWVAASGRPRYPGFLPYYAAKRGILGLVEAQALELAPKVLVNAIAPGPILPPKTLKNEEVRDVAKVTPLKRWGGAGEIAKAALFLCETDFVTGECIRVDGGRHLF